jgi:hypothetical protein
MVRLPGRLALQSRMAVCWSAFVLASGGFEQVRVAPTPDTPSA